MIALLTKHLLIAAVQMQILRYSVVHHDINVFICFHFITSLIYIFHTVTAGKRAEKITEILAYLARAEERHACHDTL